MVNIPEVRKEHLRKDTELFLNLPIENYFFEFSKLHKLPYQIINYEFFVEEMFRLEIVAKRLNIDENKKKEFYDFELKQLIVREKFLFDNGFKKPSENLVREGSQITKGKENVRVISNQTGKELTKGTGDVLFMSVSGMFWDMTNRLAWHSKESIEKGDQPWAIKYYTMLIVAGFTTIESFINSCAKEYIDGLNLENEDDTPETFGDEFKQNRKGNSNWKNIVYKLKKWPKYISGLNEDWKRDDGVFQNFLKLKQMRDDIIHNKKQAEDANSITRENLIFVCETVRDLCTVISEYLFQVEPKWLSRYIEPLEYE